MRVEDSQGIRRLVILIVNVLSISLTIFGNCLILRAFFKVRSLRTPANSLLISLAAVDILFVVLFLCEFVAHRPVKAFGCLVHVFLGQFFFSLMSMVLLNLAAISIDRLVAVKFSLRYNELVTTRRVQVAIAIVWIISVAINVVPLIVKIIWASIETDDEESFVDLFLASHPPGRNISYRRSVCINNSTRSVSPSLPVRREHFFWIFIIILLLPYVITIVCHAWIFKISRQHYKRLKANQERFCPHMNLQMKHAKTTAIVMGSFLILFTPLLVMVTYKFFNGRCCQFSVLRIAKLISSQCAWLNPPIYAWRNKDFRKAMCEILKPASVRLCCCRDEDEIQADARGPNAEQT